MALTFPLSAAAFIDLLGIEDATFTPARNDQLSGLGNNQPLNAEMASPLWRVDISSGPMPNEDAQSVAALIEVLERPGNDFYIYNPRKLGPRMDRTGAILGAATPTLASVNANNRQITIGGLPAGYVVSRGDMFSFEYGPTGQKRRALHRLVEGATANGTTPTTMLEVFSHIRAGWEAGTPITLIKPTMRAKLIPGSYKITAAGALHSRISFSAIQKLI